MAGIREDYERVMADLGSLLRLEAQQILERIRTYQDELARPDSTHRDPKTAANLSHLAQMAGNLTYCLNNEVEVLRLATGVTFERGNIFNVPSDGNCLYHAFILGLFFYNKINPAVFSHVHLREQVVRELHTELAKNPRERDPFLEASLEMSISDYQESRIRLKRDELEGLRAIATESTLDAATAATKIAPLEAEIANLERELPMLPRDYLALAAQPGFFGSTAEIFSLGRLYPDIQIIVKSSDVRQTTLITVNLGQTDTITLVLSSSHYTTLLEIHGGRTGTGATPAAAAGAV